MTESSESPHLQPADSSHTRNWGGFLGGIFTLLGFGPGVLIAWLARTTCQRFHRNGVAMTVLFVLLFVGIFVGGYFAYRYGLVCIVFGILALADGVIFLLPLGLAVVSIPIGSFVGLILVAHLQRKHYADLSQ